MLNMTVSSLSGPALSLSNQRRINHVFEEQAAVLSGELQGHISYSQGPTASTLSSTRDLLK